MKLPTTLIHQSSHGSASFGLLALTAAIALLLSGSCLEARDYAGYHAGGYHAAAYHGYGYGVSYGYGYGAAGVVNVTNVNSNPAPSAPSLPPGTLTALPSGSAPVQVMGQTYFFANGNYYSAQSYGGSTVFVVANP